MSAGKDRMEILKQFYVDFSRYLPLLFTVAFASVMLWTAHWLLLRRRPNLGSEGRTPRQIAMLLLSVVAFIGVLLALPLPDTTRGQLLSLVGVVLTAVIALSSTSFVANAMAGLMLRTVRSFRPGDFIRVGEQFGRVTERGLFHTEIQTEDRDLTTLPNLYLVANPLTVVRSSGTIVSAKLSLGYDISHATVSPLLLEAAAAAKLQDPFVQVVDLGDFSVTYRVAGFLSETKHLLTTRSRLRKRVLDTLHKAGVEIVSPSFMNQRVLRSDKGVLPEDTGMQPRDDRDAPETLIFDKAEEAQKIEQLRGQHTELLAEIKELEAQLSGLDQHQRTLSARVIDLKRHETQTIKKALDEAEKEKAKDE